MIYNPHVLQLRTPEALRAELERVGAESSISTLNDQASRLTFRIVKLEDVSLALARLLYQELVMEGGQVVTAPALDHVGPGTTPVLLCGTRDQLQRLIVRLRWQSSEELQLLADELETSLERFEQGPPPPAAGLFDWRARTYVVGIVNVTPNSFSGDGLIHDGDRPAEFVDRAVEHALRLAAEGADLIDIGGESTHPSARPVDAETEMGRVVPVIRALRSELSLPLSVDTYKAGVAREALEAGAQIVNDVWGLRRDPELKCVVAEHGAHVVITHNWLDRGPHPPAPSPVLREKGPGDGGQADFLGDIITELRAQVEAALNAGIPEARIIVDPGLGFGKTREENLELLNRLVELRVLGLPILIGPSRKGFIARTVGVSKGETEEGTAAAIALGIDRGANLIRVHDVKAMARVARMADAITRKRKIE